MAVVAEKTGYPPEMLELDLDLEADLGIDTVKQAETFASIRETFAIPFEEGLNLRDYPTLAAVIGFVHTMRPELAPSAASTQTAAVTPSATAGTPALRPRVPSLPMARRRYPHRQRTSPPRRSAR